MDCFRNCHRDKIGTTVEGIRGNFLCFFRDCEVAFGPSTGIRTEYPFHLLNEKAIYRDVVGVGFNDINISQTGAMAKSTIAYNIHLLWNSYSTKAATTIKTGHHNFRDVFRDSD